MITDQETNMVYFSSVLLERTPLFFEALASILSRKEIYYQLLDKTADIWCRDFMPIQVNKDKFVQFQYDPDYLKGKYQHLKTNPDIVCDHINICSLKSEIKLDGGNVVKSKSKCILTDKIFKENPSYEKQQLIKVLSVLLEVDEIIIIPRQPYDITGHSDGMVRFIDESAVLLCDYRSAGESNSFIQKLERILSDHHLEIVQLAYYIDQSKFSHGMGSAKGCYINYLELGDVVLMPIFDLPTDEFALRQMQKALPNKKIEPILSNEVAIQGGVLNCISWNIKQS